MTKTPSWEVYGEGVGFLGYVSAKTEIGAKRIARQLWTSITSFSVTSLNRPQTRAPQGDLVRIAIERAGSSYTVRAEAPAGFIWSGTFTHEIVESGRGDASASKKSVRESMSYGVQRCTTVDCEYCADNGVVIKGDEA